MSYKKNGSSHIEEENVDYLRNALTLLDGVISAQNLFFRVKDAASPTADDLDAYGCAMDVIVSNKRDFEIVTVGDLEILFNTMHDTLSKLTGNQSGELPSNENIDKTRLFFKELSEHMLAQLSPKGDEISPLI